MAVNNGYDSVRGAVNRIGRNKPDWGKGEDKNWGGGIYQNIKVTSILLFLKKKGIVEPTFLYV